MDGSDLHLSIQAFEPGDLVTVISAHPCHKIWYGIVVECHFPRTYTDIPKHWEKKYSIRKHNFQAKERWYYVVFGNGFVIHENMQYTAFIDTNLEKAY